MAKERFAILLLAGCGPGTDNSTCLVSLHFSALTSN